MSRIYRPITEGWRGWPLFLIALCLTGSTLSFAAAKKPAAPAPPKGQKVALPYKGDRALQALKGRRIAATGAYEREYWYWYKRSLPLGAFPPGAEAAAQARAQEFRRSSRAAAFRGVLSPAGAALSTPTWAELGPRGLVQDYGPGIVSGRVMSILLQRQQNRILIGSASGGIWKRSLAPGQVFEPKSDYAPNLSFGALAADPNNPDILYGGTGEHGISVDSFNGNGLLKSTDGGETWQRVDNGIFTNTKISQVWVDPRDSQRLLVSVLYGGMYESVNGGVNWQQRFGGAVMGFAVSPSNPDRILISNSEPGGSPTADLRLSTNGGLTYSPLNGPWQGTGTVVGRIDLAWSPSDSTVVWALVAPPTFGTDNGRAGLYRSTNSGGTFSQEAGFPSGAGGQSWYNNVVAVVPNDPTRVVFGAVDLYRYTVGGSPTQITNWFAIPGLPFIHADQHSIVFDPTDSNTFYVGNDGGVWVTRNGGTSFTDMNAGLGTIQYYNGAVGTNNGLGSLFGGTQDNGTSHPTNGQTWYASLGGDGFQCAVDPQNDNIIYGTIQFSTYAMSINGGASFFGLPSLPTLGNEGTPFFTPLAIDPSNGTRIYGGGQRVYRGISDRATSVAWTALSAGLLFPNDGVSRIAVAKTDGNVIYASGGSSFARTGTGGDPWTVSSPPGGQFITGIVVDPNNANYVVISRSGFSGGQVMRSINGGATWTNITANLPNVPANNIAILPTGGRLDAYLATDTGVYYADLNASSISWSVVGTGLPCVVVSDVLIAEGGQRLVAVTHGRGMWAMRLGPSSLSATAISSSEIDLNWIDNNTNESGFEIQRSTAGGPFVTIFTAPANATGYLDQNLASNTSYTYQLRALTPPGPTGFTNSATAITYPTTPSGLNVVTPPPLAGRTQLNLSWTDTSSRPSAFRIERSLDGTNFVEIAVTVVGATTFPSMGLVPETTYHFRVRATNQSGNSSYSNVASSTTLPAPPTSPGALTATVISSSEISLHWDDNSANETGFRVERAKGTSFLSGTGLVSFNLSANSRTFDDSGLTPSTAYIYRVIAFNVGGDSLPSTEAGGTTFPVSPNSPSGLSVTALTNASLQINWTDESSNETGFRIERSTGGGFTQVGTVAANVTTFTNTGLQSNTSYTYRVRALNGVSVSPASGTADGLTLPSIPTSLVVTPQSTTQVLLVWTDASAVPSAFKVERKTTGAYSEIGVTGVGVATYSDATAAANTTYTYRVRATNASGDSDYSSQVSGTTPPNAPNAPTNLTISVISQSTLQLNWTDASSDEAAFKIERSANGVTYIVVGSVNAGVTGFSNTGLSANTTYWYRVRATNTGGDSLPSNVVSAATLPGAPATPSGLSVTVLSQTQIQLNWTDTSSDESGFKIENSTDGTAFAQIALTGANVQTVVVGGLSANTRYYFRVKATNPGGDSTPSNVASAVTLPNPPTAPANPAVQVVSSTALKVTWSDASNNETSFVVERSLNGMTFVSAGTVAANVTSFTDNGLSPQTTYFFRVKAVNSGGSSAWSSTVSGVTPPPPPGAPTNLSATAMSSSAIQLVWADASSNETGFRVERKQGAGSFAEIGTTGANVVTFTDNGRASNTTYTYRVKSTNGGGDSAPSNSADGLTLPTTPGSLLVSVTSSTRLDLTWTETNPQPAAVRVERAILGGGFTDLGEVQAGITTFANTGLAPDTTYQYRVRASNASGFSAYTDVIVGTTLPAAPAAPTGLAAVPAGAGTINLTWSDASNNETGFKVERSLDGVSFGQISMLGAGVTSLSDSGLLANTTYTYRVRAYNAGGNSNYSGSASATTVPNAPSAPTALAVSTISTTQLNLTWLDNSVNETGFKIERSSDGTNFSVIATTAANATAFANTGLTAGTTFQYRVRATNGGGDSAFSGPISGTTFPNAPAAPTNLTATAQSAIAVRLNWTDASNTEDGFIIERRTGEAGAFTERGRTAANATQYAEDVLSAGTTYTYRVRAFNGGGQSASAEATVTTLTGVLSVSFQRASVPAGKPVNCTVTLTGPAPAGGALIALSSSASSVVKVPATVRVRAGRSSVTFAIQTKKAGIGTAATITASYGGGSAGAVLTLVR